MNRFTEGQALERAGVDADRGIDYIRHQAYILSVCLGCGMVNRANSESQRIVYRDQIDWDAIDCCPDSDRIVY